MMIVASQVGIDVAQEHLDVSVDGKKPFRIANNEEACKALSERLSEGSVVHLESSGGYERVVRTALREAGLKVNTHDPLKVRRYAQACGRKAKTDSLDAKRLASDGSSLDPQQEKSLEREALADISRTIDRLKKEAAKMKVRANLPALAPVAKEAYLRAASDLHKRAEALEKEFLARVRKSSLSERHQLATSVPGVGPCLARVVVCELPESLEAFTHAQLCSYAGVAPIDDGSGKRKGGARIGRGNARLKAALYMPALSCLGTQPWAKELYARLRAKGRLHQQAVVAVMRRLLMRLLAVVKRGSPWKDEPPNP